MDFSKSLSIGENTFQEIDDCEAKVKRGILQVYNEQHSLLCSNQSDLGNEIIGNSKQNCTQKLTDSTRKSEMCGNCCSNSNSYKTFKTLAVEMPIEYKREEIKNPEEQPLGAASTCLGKNSRLKHSPVSIALKNTAILPF